MTSTLWPRPAASPRAGGATADVAPDPPVATSDDPGARVVVDPGLRVLIDGRYLTDRYPGVGRYVFNLAAALPRLAPRSRFLLLVDHRTAQTRFDLARLASDGVELVPTQTGVRSPRGRLAAARLCRRLGADVFHATHLLSAGRAPCATVLTLYDVIPLRPEGRLSTSWRRALYRLLLRRAVRTATGIVTLSEAAAGDIAARGRIDRARIAVTPAAAGGRFRPVPAADVAALRARLGLPARYVLTVGTAKPQKNLARLVDAWARLPRGSAAGAALVIAGLPATHRPAVRPASNVVVLGAVPESDLPALYGGARLVVQPSLCEGFGLPVLEAMACGAPVACAAIPVFDEVAGDAAARFEPTSVDAIAAAIDRVLGDDALRATLVDRGARRARSFSWGRTAALTVAAYAAASRAHAGGGRR